MGLDHEFHLRLGESHYRDLVWLEKELGESRASVIRQALRHLRREIEREKDHRKDGE